MTEPRTLDVWWGRKRVGVLSQDRSGDLAFQYDANWVGSSGTRAVSISLPKRLAPFTRRECRPFFAGLLPDEAQRTFVADALGVSDRNDFALLEGLGGDVAGALELFASGSPPATGDHAVQADALPDSRLVDILGRLPARPMLAGENGLRLSLAGAQSKLPVVLVGGDVALPAAGQPTTHILKPPIGRFAATTENEAAVMRLAAAVGFDAARADPRVVLGHPYLLIERYDRRVGGRGPTDGTTTRMHQEDFCQALGIPPERKYAAEGGPVFKQCFDLVRRVSARPAQDVLKLVDAAIFNLIVGNADAHGKNFSLLYTDDGVRLAPAYDLLSTVQYPDLSPTLAMKFGRAGALEDLNEDNWERFSADAGITGRYLRRRARELSDRVGKLAQNVCAEVWKPGLDEAALSRLSEEISRRAGIFGLKIPAVSRRSKISGASE